MPASSFRLSMCSRGSRVSPIFVLLGNLCPLGGMMMGLGMEDDEMGRLLMTLVRQWPGFGGEAFLLGLVVEG